MTWMKRWRYVELQCLIDSGGVPNNKKVPRNALHSGILLPRAGLRKWCGGLSPRMLWVCSVGRKRGRPYSGAVIRKIDLRSESGGCWTPWLLFRERHRLGCALYMYYTPNTTLFTGSPLKSCIRTPMQQRVESLPVIMQGFANIYPLGRSSMQRNPYQMQGC